MSIDTFGPAKDWVKNLNNDLQALDQTDIVVSDWPSEGVVLLNGWFPAGNNSGGNVSYRTIAHRSGEVILTVIRGTLETKDRWDGTRVNFAQIAGVPRPSSDALFGSSMISNVNGVSTGYADVSYIWENNNLVLQAIGRRNESGHWGFMHQNSTPF